MVLSRTVSEINGDFSQNRQFFHPRVFNAEGVPGELGIGALGRKSSNDGATRQLKSFKIGLVV